LNRFTAKVKKILPLKRLNLIKFDYEGQEINVLILEMNIGLKPGKRAELSIKPTAVSVLKNECGFENALKGTVSEINNGEILSSVTVKIGGNEIESIMLKERACGLKGDVFVVFKANDIAVSKVLDD